MAQENIDIPDDFEVNFKITCFQKLQFSAAGWRVRHSSLLRRRSEVGHHPGRHDPRQGQTVG